MKYNLEEINKKASYCLNCKTKPCKGGCPLQNNIPDFIQKIKQKDYNGAFDILKETTIFEPICGRVCPHKSQCEGSCTRGIKGDSVSIGKLEAFIGDYALENINISIDSNKNKKIAIIGSGPAGLACAYYLSVRGYEVTIYEKHSKLGGLLRYGIPAFRLNKELLDNWLNKFILNKNVKYFVNKELGKDIYLEDLKKEYDNIVLAFGANVSNKMGIDGEELEFVLGGNELLEYKKYPNFKGKTVGIIGGGNVAIDSARTIKKLGAKEVCIIYRRSEKQMPAEICEIKQAKEEGIKFLFQTNIVKIFEDKLKRKIECVKTELIKKEGETREYPVNIANSNFFLNVDFVILAIGSTVNKKVINKLNLEVNKWGYIKVDENYKTSDNSIYAIGDLIGNNKTVAWAAKSGFECAKKIDGKI